MDEHAINEQKLLKLKVTDASRYAFLYITGEGAEEKALKLSGSDVGGWTVIVITDRITEPSARRAPNSKYTTNFLETRALIKVTGYDASLPADDIKTALSKHFSSCGEIEKVTIGGHPSSCRAIVYITGEGAQEKALALSGSDMGGCKLVAKPAMVPVKNRKRIHHGAPHLAHLFKEAQMYWGAQMAKTMKNTEEAKMLWVNEMGMGSDIPPEVMMLWDAEMSRRDLLPKN
ncbi:unnamed protein product [Thlaspi arvense]|uniref:RRM domain-containing protein n=1 Tax=Thlaspi arvense TaxID=13288 RepID=A0AAU9SKP3_THLAR|nr:unnamed protein product [Thlaspi arvense]